MKGKIALEEHFAIPETLQDSAGFVPGDYWTELSARCTRNRVAPSHVAAKLPRPNMRSRFSAFALSKAVVAA
jgi:hypothetical protein